MYDSLSLQNSSQSQSLNLTKACKCNDTVTFLCRKRTFWVLTMSTWQHSVWWESIQNISTCQVHYLTLVPPILSMVLYMLSLKPTHFLFTAYFTAINHKEKIIRVVVRGTADVKKDWGINMNARSTNFVTGENTLMVLRVNCRVTKTRKPEWKLESREWNSFKLKRHPVCIVTSNLLG